VMVGSAVESNCWAVLVGERSGGERRCCPGSSAFCQRRRAVNRGQAFKTENGVRQLVAGPMQSERTRCHQVQARGLTDCRLALRGMNHGQKLAAGGFSGLSPAHFDGPCGRPETRRRRLWQQAEASAGQSLNQARAYLFRIQSGGSGLPSRHTEVRAFSGLCSGEWRVAALAS
jgi:hypothetical protein